MRRADFSLFISSAREKDKKIYLFDFVFLFSFCFL